jgi:glycosyltransferase involved in cell wall biosynthesis
MSEEFEKRITIFIPTFNEEVRLAEILKAYGEYAYVVIADNHSADNTVKVAEEFGAICFNRTNQSAFISIDDWKKAFKLAPTEWIFCASCSELITNDIFQEFYKNVLDSTFNAMYVERHSYTYGVRTHRLRKNASAQMGSALKIFKKEYIDWEKSKIHQEVPLLIDKKDIYICKNKSVYHFRSGVPRSVELKLSEYADIEAEYNFKIGKRFGFLKMLLSALWHSFNIGILNRTTAGLICAIYQFQITTNIYIRLWLLDNYSDLENVDVDTTELRRKLLEEFSDE